METISHGIGKQKVELRLDVQNYQEKNHSTKVQLKASLVLPFPSHSEGRRHKMDPSPVGKSYLRRKAHLMSYTSHAVGLHIHYMN